MTQLAISVRLLNPAKIQHVTSDISFRNDIPSGYVQSVVGQGRQQVRFCSSGIGMQKRPGMTEKDQQWILEQADQPNGYVHPPSTGKALSCKKGVGHKPLVSDEAIWLQFGRQDARSMTTSPHGNGSRIMKSGVLRRTPAHFQSRGGG